MRLHSAVRARRQVRGHKTRNSYSYGEPQRSLGRSLTNGSQAQTTAGPLTSPLPLSGLLSPYKYRPELEAGGPVSIVVPPARAELESS
jgi:hypothetical protein